MRALLVIAALTASFTLTACGKDKDKNPPPGNTASGLERPPGDLPRPPSEGLPDDLKPPRD
jgi:hypothetical protein